MPVTLTPIRQKDCWSGSTWTIEDEDQLAELLARVAIGQSRTVERILRATGDLPARYPKGGFEGARKLLTVGTGDKTYHRDGWVFQVIAWIAAHRFDDEALIRAPQMIKADKGLDGLIIEFDSDGKARLRESSGDPYGVTTKPIKQYVRPDESSNGGSAASTVTPNSSQG